MPAEGKLEVGDQMIKIDEQSIEQTDDLLNYIKKKQSGDIVKITLIRDDEELEKEVSLEEFDEIDDRIGMGRSEEHTSELQSRFDLVCRLLLEKKKRK